MSEYKPLLDTSVDAVVAELPGGKQLLADEIEFKTRLELYCQLSFGVDFETIVRGTPGVDYVPVRETWRP